MTTTPLSLVASLFLLASSNLATAGCDSKLERQFADAQRLVDSLRPDKPGQARVTAVDGSEYTAAQSQWMKGRLQFVRHACEQGDLAAATAGLRSVTDLLIAHRRA